jgi:hypothetical protein
MNQNIAMNDCDALELTEGASLTPQETDSHAKERRDGQGPPVFPAARLPHRERLPNRRNGYTQKARVGGQNPESIQRNRSSFGTRVKTTQQL